MPLYIMELKSNLKSFLIWLFCIAVLFVFSMSMFPSFSSQGERLEELMSSFPEEFKTALSMNTVDFTKPLDYMAYIFQYILLAAGMYIMLLSTTILSREESDGTIEILYSKPVSRMNIYRNKFLFLLTNSFLLSFLFTVVSSVTVNVISNGEADVKTIILTGVSMFFLQLFFLGIGIFISSFVKAGKSMSISLGLVFSMYFLSMISGLNEKFEFLKYLTPFKYFDPVLIIKNNGIDFIHILMTVVITIVTLLSGALIYNKKDL